jgi:hypothetical protein
LATLASESDESASPIWPSSPATSPAPNTMKTAIPLAVADRKTEPASDTAAMMATASASPSAGTTMRSGHQPPVMRVITAVARKTAIT